jgi:hypothetical protein
MKQIQQFYLYGYRLTGFIFLIGLITSILWYGFSILFFTVNAGWSVPLILSPNQENVMTHLHRAMSLEVDLRKNKAELSTAKEALGKRQALLKHNQDLLIRFQQSMTSQMGQQRETSQFFNNLAAEKDKDIVALTQFSADVQRKESDINQELKIGLITQEEALNQHLALNKLHTELFEAKARAYELHQRANEFNDAANTLNGAANNLDAMQLVVKKVELDNQIEQITSDIFALTIEIQRLEKNIKKKQIGLSMMKDSPYILATHHSTQVAFVPYHNLNHVKVGGPIYSCYLDMILCYRSGHITHIYNAEAYSKHPVFKSEIKGRLIGIAFNDETDAQKRLLFLNSKPLLF